MRSLTPAVLVIGALAGVSSCRATAAASPIRHVVIVVQENRTFDNLFNGYPGANSVDRGVTSDGRTVALAPVGFEYPKDIGHSHAAWLKQYAGGKLFFDLGAPEGEVPEFPYAVVPRDETKPYWDLAARYTLGDAMFQSNTGPSFPAHLYLIAGGAQMDAGRFAASNPQQNDQGLPLQTAWGCDDKPGTTIAQLGSDGLLVRHGAFPCYDTNTLADELDAKGLGWRYYAPAIGAIGGAWSAFDAIRHIREGPEWSTNVVSPETSILSDAPGNHLAAVTWVVPSGKNSDHAGSRSATGPQWVASVVNAIGHSADWDSTAILITWDDWGGWYDHVVPPQVDAMGLGFRVPLLVVSPYAKTGYVSHVQHEFGSVLHFAERTFGLAPLAPSDARADDLSDCFDFTKSPAPFTAVRVTVPPGAFASAPGDAADDD